jgi:methionyl-tRNA formyltransferase
MRLVFAGTPALAAGALQALIDAGHDIGLVLTQPDRPAGRGLKAAPSAVKKLALAHGIPVAQPDSLRSDEALEMLRGCGAAAMVVAAYGLILPPSVLDIFPRGCINIHASLLPRWRGAAPIQRAILAGDHETGISIMRMDAGLDTGPVLLERVTPIAEDDTAGSLHDRLAEMGAAAIVEALAGLEARSLDETPQNEGAATYAAKIDKAEANIDWTQKADAIARRVRAFNPFPGATTTIGGVRHKIWRAVPCDGAGRPGTVFSAGNDGIVVTCGQGALRILELQPAGGKRLQAGHYLHGRSLIPGAVIGD